MSTSSRRWLLVVVAVSVLLRIAVALYLGDTVPPAKDEISYSTLAARVATGHGFSFPIGWYPFTSADTPTSHWSFLYTAFVAGVYFVFGPHPLAARLVQAGLAGVLMPWLMWRLTRRITSREAQSKDAESQVVPLLAALLTAAYAYFVLYGAMVQTEAFFVCAVLWSLERGMAVEDELGNEGRVKLQISLTLGLSLGVATLLRQSILPWVAVMFGYLLWVGWRAARASALPTLRRGAAALFVVGAVMAVCILPFTVRNYLAYRDFLLLNSNAGYAMYSAQHPLHGTTFQEYAAAPLPEDLVNKGLNEADWDKALMRRGVGFVLDEPGRYLLLSLSRVRDYFEFWPSPDSSTLFNLGRVLSIGVFLPFMICGVIIAVRRYGSRLALIYLFIAFYSVLHILTWAMSRYRLPVDAVALLFAAMAIVELGERVAGRNPLALPGSR